MARIRARNRSVSRWKGDGLNEPRLPNGAEVDGLDTHLPAMIAWGGAHVLELDGSSCRLDEAERALLAERSRLRNLSSPSENDRSCLKMVESVLYQLRRDPTELTRKEGSYLKSVVRSACAQDGPRISVVYRVGGNNLTPDDVRRALLGMAAEYESRGRHQVADECRGLVGSVVRRAREGRRVHLPPELWQELVAFVHRVR